MDGLCFSHDDKILITGDIAGNICCFHLETGTAIGQPFNAHNGRGIYSLMLLQDGCTIVTSSWDETIGLFHFSQQKLLSEVAINMPVSSMQFESDGLHLTHSNGAKSAVAYPDSVVTQIRSAPTRNGNCTQCAAKDKVILDLVLEKSGFESQIAQHLAEKSAKDAEILELRKQLAEAKAGNNQPAARAFVVDKPYRINLEGLGLSDLQLGSMATLPSGNVATALLDEAKRLMKIGGSAFPVPSPVAGFNLVSIDVIGSDFVGLESRMRQLQVLRQKGGNLFNPQTSAFDVEQLQTLIALRDYFLPRPASMPPQHPNLIYTFHGTRIDRLDSVISGLAKVKSTDAGYFGSGVYTTPNIEYAAKYAAGEFSSVSVPRRSDGCVPVVWCCAAVGVAYPVTPKDIDATRQDGHTKFFGAPLQTGFDCHVVAVSQASGFLVVPRDRMQYMEIVFDQEMQVLPIAVLWMKEREF